MKLTAQIKKSVNYWRENFPERLHLYQNLGFAHSVLIESFSWEDTGNGEFFSKLFLTIKEREELTDDQRNFASEFFAHAYRPFEKENLQ